jgi:hypothetical protein
LTNIEKSPGKLPFRFGLVAPQSITSPSRFLHRGGPFLLC